MSDKEQDKFIFKGVKVTLKQAAFVQKIADRKFEGNFSMALRSVLSEAHKDFELCKSLN